MIETLHTVVAFIIALALLITVHEFGHYLVARRLGIKVEKFSIGFGRALFSWRSRDREVEFVIAAIPLGGYVKMLGEQGSEEPISDKDRARAFDNQPVWKRFCVAVAGPFANFLFAIAAYMLVGWMGQQVLPPVVGSVSPGSSAELAGILPGDRINSIAGEGVHSWRQVEEITRNRLGGQVQIAVDRGGRDFIFKAQLPNVESEPLLTDIPVESLGIAPGMKIKIVSIVKSSAADRAGLQNGDRIMAIEDVPVATVRDLIKKIRENAGNKIVLTVQRTGRSLNVGIKPDESEGHGRIGVQLAAESLEAPELYRMGFVDGIAYGFSRTWGMTSMTLEMLGKMLTASISPENLGGPIAIAQLAGKTASMGFIAFLTFLALVSVNLGVINLLPVPVLDGGQVVYLGLEKIIGRPLSVTFMERTQIVGITLLGLLMIFAFYNDLLRLFKG